MSEIDIEGEATLRAIANADKFNYWMYEQMLPFIKGDVLEIGSGIGNISKYINTEGRIFLSDLRDHYIERLREEHPEKKVLKMDLVDPDFSVKHAELLGTFDFVFALNVVEHIEDDKLALSNISSLLKKDGLMFILVPAYQMLYNHFDTALGHYRRYSPGMLKQALPKTMLPLKTWHFNSLGILGWFFVGKILRKKIIPESNMKIYNKITPLVKFMDFLFNKKLGLSVINVSKRIS